MSTLLSRCADYNYGRCAPLFWQIAFILPPTGKFSPRRRVKKPLIAGDFIIPDLSVCCISNKIGPAKQDFPPGRRSKSALQSDDVMLRVYIIFSGGAQIREWQKSSFFTQIIALCAFQRELQKSPTCACVCCEDPLAMYLASQWS